MRKTILTEHYICSVQKTARKNTKYFRNETTLKIGHLAKGIADAKWSVLVKNLKCQKHAKKHSKRTLELFCAKNRPKKHQTFQKCENFENRPSCKNYTPCKMVSLRQKLKMPKACEKPFCKNIRPPYSLSKMVSLGQKLEMPKTCEKPF